MTALPFTHLGRYRIVRELGRGAMGVVYLAEDEALQRQVAVKTLLLPQEPGERRQVEARFRQEAKAAGGLNHPNTITVYDFGREGDWLYIAMELLQGVELRERIQAGTMALDEALDIAAQVASGLAAAHARGVVHRDVKPGNIMLLPGGLAKIMDFGIARMASSDVRTRTGTMMGSPRYMSPEQVGGHAVDHRSDIFSLGSVLYEMVTGEAAFRGANIGQLLQAILHGAPAPPSQLRPGLPASLQVVIARAMQKNEQARYQDAAEMARDLQQCRSVLARSRGVEQPTSTVAVDFDLGTLPGSVPTPAATEGLAPSVHFDSSAGLQRLLTTRGSEGVPAPAPSDGLRRAAWVLAYATAVVAALAIAFA